MKSKLIVGLGNPGEKFDRTPHNLGFDLLDAYAHALDLTWTSSRDFEGETAQTRLEIGTEALNLFLLKPQTYMNESGRSVRALMSYYKIGLEDLILAHDDLDLDLGDWKIQLGKGPKSHNGVNDVQNRLGNPNFNRIRLGAECRESKSDLAGQDYVLKKFSEDQYVTALEAIDAILESEQFNALLA